MRVAQLRVLGGAMARVPADATAFAHRSSRIMVNIAAFYDGPDDGPRVRPGSTSSPRPSTRATPAPTSTSSATRATSGSMPPIRARPGTGSPRSRRATTRRTSSSSTRTSRLRPEGGDVADPAESQGALCPPLHPDLRRHAGCRAVLPAANSGARPAAFRGRPPGRGRAPRGQTDRSGSLSIVAFTALLLMTKYQITTRLFGPRRVRT